MQAYSFLINKKTKQKKKKKKKIDTWRCLLSSYRSVSAMKKKKNFVLYIMNFFISVGRSRCIFKTKI